MFPYLEIHMMDKFFYLDLQLSLSSVCTKYAVLRFFSTLFTFHNRKYPDWTFGLWGRWASWFLKSWLFWPLLNGAKFTYRRESIKGSPIKIFGGLKWNAWGIYWNLGASNKNLVVCDEKLGVSNENMGVSEENLWFSNGIMWAPMKILWVSDENLRRAADELAFGHGL